MAARLRVFALAVGSTSGGTTQIRAFPLRREWVPAEATWVRASESIEWGGAGASGGSDRISSPVGLIEARTFGGWISLDVTRAVQDWWARAMPNEGLLIEMSSAGSVELALASGGHPDVSKRPTLEVIFLVPLP